MNYINLSVPIDKSIFGFSLSIKLCVRLIIDNLLYIDDNIN